MLISFKHVSDLFSIAKDSVDGLRQEVAALRAERDALASDLRDTKLNNDWLRIQFNTLQIERTALLDRLYGLKSPTPQIVPSAVADPIRSFQDALFADMGDEEARKQGLPVYA
ncbi:MAG: hypothetical protein LC723_05065 [Actinobacteria bacterium]|nr:hypothetical protein [Actinomycetota bacterium]